MMIDIFCDNNIQRHVYITIFGMLYQKIPSCRQQMAQYRVLCRLFNFTCNLWRICADTAQCAGFLLGSMRAFFILDFYVQYRIIAGQ